ncbi:hypothetical protein [Sporosarcina koreensis]|uniref:hypothetical protein n=1 Tax=Sporosarcina koreensis TaxID=334735 RepID=UPI000758CFE8|nr:hypothetical protein [Sporosarcina koreensis]
MHSPSQGLLLLATGEVVGNGNFSFYKNPEVDKLIELARTEANEEKRMEIYAQLQEIELEESPLIPIRTIDHLAVVAKDIDNVWMNPVGFFFFE